MRALVQPAHRDGDTSAAGRADYGRHGPPCVAVVQVSDVWLGAVAYDLTTGRPGPCYREAATWADLPLPWPAVHLDDGCAGPPHLLASEATAPRGPWIAGAVAGVLYGTQPLAHPAAELDGDVWTLTAPPAGCVPYLHPPPAAVLAPLAPVPEAVRELLAPGAPYTLRLEYE